MFELALLYVCALVMIGWLAFMLTIVGYMAWQPILGLIVVGMIWAAVGWKAVLVGLFLGWVFLTAVAVIYCWTRDVIRWYRRHRVIAG